MVTDSGAWQIVWQLRDSSSNDILFVRDHVDDFDDDNDGIIDILDDDDDGDGIKDREVRVIKNLQTWKANII